MNTQKWQCPYCGLGQLTSHESANTNSAWLQTEKSKYGKTKLYTYSRTCLNPQCGEIALNVGLCSYESEIHGTIRGLKTIEEWKLRPTSSTKPQSDYIPKTIISDYTEACMISALSPKASATLARRCIQGMIRDFCGISKSRLIDEIDELRERVTQGKAPKGVQMDAIEAIDHVRKIGNIGAHMEKDINLIIDVDSDEANKLIELIELLFKEWYVERHDRSQRLTALKEVAEDKQQIKNGAN